MNITLLIAALFVSFVANVTLSALLVRMVDKYRRGQELLQFYESRDSRRKQLVNYLKSVAVELDEDDEHEKTVRQRDPILGTQIQD